MGGAEQVAALEGRLPILPAERLFVRGSHFLASCVVFGAALWIFMVGAALASLGDVRYAIPGYLIGMVLGFVPVLLSTGLPSFRYGIDPIDAARATFGHRGAYLPLAGLLYVALAWAGVIICFIAKGMLTVTTAVTSVPSPNGAEPAMVLLIGLAAWQLVRLGPRAMEAMNNVVAPGILVIATILLILLGHRIGWTNIWVAHVPSSGWLFQDRHVVLMVALDLGVGSSMGSWPFLGGLTRLVKYRRHVVAPSLLGTTLIGLGFGSSVCALIANALPSTDPVVWILDLAGVYFGGALTILLLIANIAVVGLFIYFAAVALQQAAWVRKQSWSVVIAVLLIPVLIGACFPDRVLTAVMTINNYQGMLFVGITGVSAANYLFVLRQRLDLRSIFTQAGHGAYRGIAGVKWPALISSLLGSGVYLLLFNPMTAQPGPGFAWFGASIPAMLSAAISFLILQYLFPARATRDAVNPPLHL